MNIDYISVLTHLGVGLLASILTVYILYKFFDTDKLMRRKPPLGVVSDSLKYLATKLQSRKYIYNLWEIGNRIGWSDWHRGFGYGYLDEEEQPSAGDVIQVRLRTNNSKLKNRVMRLIIYRVEQPDETIPNFFLFRTYFGGFGVEKRREKDEEIGARFRSFQRLT